MVFKFLILVLLNHRARFFSTITLRNRHKTIKGELLWLSLDRVGPVRGLPA